MSSSEPPGKSRLSSRGKNFLKPPPRYLTKAFEAWGDRYDPDDNPEGYLFLGIAENKLSAPLVSEKIEQCRGHSPSTLAYDLMGGSQMFREALANLFSKRIFRHKVNADNFVTMAGAGAVVDNLATSICEEGDHLLLCTPAYKGFENDIELRARCNLALAHATSKDSFRVSKQVLDKGLRQAQERGETVKGVLLCTPVNPTGQVLTAHELVDIVKWCRQHSLHCIVDEIYALSVFDKESNFVSVYQALWDANMSLGDDVHVVWSFSKDFCSSGYRVGVCYTENKALLGGLQAAAYFCACSTDTQASLTKMLNDDQWLQNYTIENNCRLREAYEETTSFWKSVGIEYISSCSGFFVWINLNPFMKKEGVEGWEGESHVTDLLMDHCRVVLTPGGDSFCNEPGWYRCCFAALTHAERQVAWARIRTWFY